MSCPICAADTDAKFRPFCSKRCADLDLARWLGGGYAIPSDDPEDADEVARAMMAREDEDQGKPH
jgi:endogenous inhibitor of DNA gyrase (YacG/DUF329 family)